jgi:hypothetical protein
VDLEAFGEGGDVARQARVLDGDDVGAREAVGSSCTMSFRSSQNVASAGNTVLIGLAEMSTKCGGACVFPASVSGQIHVNFLTRSTPGPGSPFTRKLLHGIQSPNVGNCTTW